MAMNYCTYIDIMTFHAFILYLSQQIIKFTFKFLLSADKSYPIHINCFCNKNYGTYLKIYITGNGGTQEVL